MKQLGVTSAVQGGGKRRAGSTTVQKASEFSRDDNGSRKDKQPDPCPAVWPHQKRDALKRGSVALRFLFGLLLLRHQCAAASIVRRNSSGSLAIFTAAELVFVNGCKVIVSIDLTSLNLTSLNS